MGITSSKPNNTNNNNNINKKKKKRSIPSNDYELAIKSSKELEYLLEHEFHATGKGLHEKISSVESKLTLLHKQHCKNHNDQHYQDLIKNMRYLATIRNKLVHEHGFDSIPDRAEFVKKFEWSAKTLEDIFREEQKKKKKNNNNNNNNNTDACIIM